MHICCYCTFFYLRQALPRLGTPCRTPHRKLPKQRSLSVSNPALHNPTLLSACIRPARPADPCYSTVNTQSEGWISLCVQRANAIQSVTAPVGGGSSDPPAHFHRPADLRSQRHHLYSQSQFAVPSIHPSDPHANPMLRAGVRHRQGRSRQSFWPFSLSL